MTAFGAFKFKKKISILRQFSDFCHFPWGQTGNLLGLTKIWNWILVVFVFAHNSFNIIQPQCIPADIFPIHSWQFRKQWEGNFWWPSYFLPQSGSSLITFLVSTVVSLPPVTELNKFPIHCRKSPEAELFKWIRWQVKQHGDGIPAYNKKSRSRKFYP